MKKCIKCTKIKDISLFYHNSKMADGKLNTCKDCFLEYKAKKSIFAKEKYGIGLRTINSLGLKLALMVYDRSGRKCEECFSENDLTIHHKDGNGRHNEEKGLFVNNDFNNLQVLCRKCHGSIHGKQGKGIKKRRKVLWNGFQSISV